MTTPLHSATSTGASLSGTGNLTGSIATQDGDTVILFANNSNGAAAPSAVTCGGAAMTRLDFIGVNNAAAPSGLYAYAIEGVPEGALALEVDGGNSFGWCAGAVAYSDVGSISATFQTAFGSNATNPSQAVTVPAGSIVVQGFAVGGAANLSASTDAGAINRITTVSSTGWEGMAVNEVNASTTLHSTPSPATHSWCALAITLNPHSGTSVSPSSATVTVAGGTPSITDTSPSTFTPASATVSVVGGTPEVFNPVIVEPASAHVAVTGGTPLLSGAPFAGVLAKLQAGQSVTIQTIGDSTVAGHQDGANLNGWVGRLGIILGTYFNVSVLVADYNSTTGVYGAAATYHSGAGSNTITVLNGGVGSTSLANQTIFLANGLLTVSNPDVILISTGFNELINQSYTVAGFVSQYEAFIPAVRGFCPTAPIVVTTENPLGGAYGVYAAGMQTAFSALTTAFVGQNLPVSPALAWSSAFDVWILDTQQAFGSTFQSALSADGIHPNAAGYAVEANWMASELAPTVSVGGSQAVTPASATVTVAGGLADVSAPVTVAPASAQVDISSGTPQVDVSSPLVGIVQTVLIPAEIRSVVVVKPFAKR